MKDDNNTELDRKWFTEYCMPWYRPFFISRALCFPLSRCPFLNNSFFHSFILLLTFRFSAMFAISVEIHRAQRKANYMFTFLCFTLKQWTTLRLIYFEKTTSDKTSYRIPISEYNLQTHTLHVQTGLHYAFDIHFVSEIRIHSISPKAN